MSKTMTPSEIADWHKTEADWVAAARDYEAAEMHLKIEAAIRELETELARKSLLSASHTALADDCVKSMHKTEAKLKIATEALDKMVALYESEHDPENLKRPQWLVEALARIKEVG